MTARRHPRHPAARADAPSPAGHDLATAEGYAAWRRAGGLWASETPGVMATYRAAQAAELAAEVDLSQVEPVRCAS